MPQDAGKDDLGPRPRMTTVAIAVYDRVRLERLKLHRREPYGDVIARLIDHAEETGDMNGPPHLGGLIDSLSDQSRAKR